MVYITRRSLYESLYLIEVADNGAVSDALSDDGDIDDVDGRPDAEMSTQQWPHLPVDAPCHAVHAVLQVLSLYAV